MEPTPPNAAPVLDTRHKLLEAAARVFARSGLDGATTREIAREAGVNEVTLFRHFQSKHKLLAAVLQRTFSDAEEKPLAAEDFLAKQCQTRGKDLRAELRPLLQSYETLLHRNILLMRTLIGEIHRHEEHEARVLKGIFAPLKVDVIATIYAARKRGNVRPEVDPLIAADLLISTIFMEVLRRTSHFVPEYSAERHLETALDVFVRGVEQTPPAADPAKATAPQP